MQLDLIDLPLFLQVAEAGSITHGARHAHFALAAASSRIRNLESILGVTLLSRAPKNHPVARRRRISFSEALGHDFIGLAEASAFQQFLSYQASTLA
jgi:hypothetical protein